MALIMNEQIKATEVELLDVDGHLIGDMPTSKALQLAKEKKVDLVCINLMQSPPQCKLIPRGKAKEATKEKSSKPKKVKEIRLTPSIEEHDYETKRSQCERLLTEGHSVALVIKLSGKQGPAAKALLEQLIKDLKKVSQPATGIQLSGKQAAVTLLPKD